MEYDSFKILIVDDSLFNQAALRYILESGLESDGSGEAGAAPKHNTILTASSGAEALMKIAQENPDLILLDIIMPGMSGFEVLKELNAPGDKQAPPVIIISGLSTEEDEEMGFSLGAVDYITRPFRKSIVLARIKNHLKIIEQMRIIEKTSLVDILTDLANRRSFDSRSTVEWGRAIREKNPLSLLMIDVDHFKLYNDAYGHQQGDAALQAVAASIQAALKRPADLAARWGGEEFAVLLPNTPSEGACHVAEQIRAAIDRVLVRGIDNTPSSHVTVSIGVASATPTLGSSFDDLVGQADRALYTAKGSGRNRVCV